MTDKTFDAGDRREIRPAAGPGLPDAPVRSVAHGAFHLERTYDASAAQVWKALTDPRAKSQWFGAPSDQVEIVEREMDVRPGGRERLKGRWGGRVVSSYDAVYYDVIETERLVYCYEMHLDDRKISVSVATIQLTPEGSRTRFQLTEQGAFLDGYDDVGSRERGTNELFDLLGKVLVTSSAPRRRHVWRPANMP